MTPMSRALLAGMLGLGVAACSSAAAREPEHRAADRWPLGNRALDRTLVAGTLIEVTIHRSLSWRRNKPGETLTATVSADVRNAHRWVVIPAGCPVGLRIAPWGPATNKSQADAKMLLDVTSVTVWGQVYPVSATVELTPVAVTPGTRILFVLPEGLTVERPLEEAHEGHATVSPASK
jgi:hypothetical protein